MVRNFCTLCPHRDKTSGVLALFKMLWLQNYNDRYSDTFENSYGIFNEIVYSFRGSIQICVETVINYLLSSYGIEIEFK